MPPSKYSSNHVMFPILDERYKENEKPTPKRLVMQPCVCMICGHYNKEDPFSIGVMYESMFGFLCCALGVAPFRLVLLLLGLVLLCFMYEGCDRDRYLSGEHLLFLSTDPLTWAVGKRQYIYVT